MILRTVLSIAILIFGTPIWAQGAERHPKPTPNVEDIRRQIRGSIEVTSGAREFGTGKYAVLHSNAGDIVVKLNTEGAPKTVENFVALGTGRKGWIHPITREEKTIPLYNGTQFYKVVPEELVFGGDPINRGEGDPGFSLDFESGLPDEFSAAGILAMQTNGPSANGSRFFFTLRPFPQMEEKHAVVGRVVAGLDVVRNISNATTKRPTIPLDPFVLYSIEVLEVPPGKLSRGQFSLEQGRPVLTMERSLAEDPTAIPAPGSPATESGSSQMTAVEDKPTTQAR